jgi:hypothetical protein
MPLNAREDFEIIKDVLNLINTEYIKYREYSTAWKKELAREIKQLIELYEHKEVKEESIIRNINRMIAYYEGTGSQARSGRKYLKYLEIILQERFNIAHEAAISLGGGIAQRFLRLEDARLYIIDIDVLKIYFNPQDKLFYVFRFPSF